MSAIAPISAISNTPSLKPLTSSKDSGQGNSAASATKIAFQDAVGSLFYGQLIKALRSGVGKPAYIHGGQAEEMFQAQMDQHVAESLAHHKGSAFVDTLYKQFLVGHPELSDQPPAELSALTQSVKSTSTMDSAQQASWARPSTSVARNTTSTTVIPVLNRK